MARLGSIGLRDLATHHTFQAYDILQDVNYSLSTVVGFLSGCMLSVHVELTAWTFHVVLAEL